VTLIVFVPAGGTPDIIARLIGQSLSQRFRQSVVIDNRPGAGGNLALQAVARAPADGYTLLMVATPHAINVTLYEKSPISITRDIVPVASINSDAFVLLVNPSFPAKTVAEFIAHAKANPGKINLASNGTGNLTHLSGELFRMMTGIEVVHVPYRGTPAAHSALMAGDVHAIFDAVGSSLPHIQSGGLRALAVTATERLRVLPDCPFFAKQLCITRRRATHPRCRATRSRAPTRAGRRTPSPTRSPATRATTPCCACPSRKRAPPPSTPSRGATCSPCSSAHNTTCPKPRAIRMRWKRPQVLGVDLNIVLNRASCSL
jgi:tripartite tricarboxylate transporter family receptor